MQKDKQKQASVPNDCDNPSFWINQEEKAREEEWEFWSSQDLAQEYEDYLDYLDTEEDRG